MDPITAGLALEFLKVARLGLGWIAARRGGNQSGALAIVQQYQNARNKDIFGEDISDALGMTAAAMAFLSVRNIEVAKALALIQAAEAEDRDLTDAEVLSFFAATDEVADRVEDALQDLENEEAVTSSESGAATADDSSPGVDTGGDSGGGAEPDDSGEQPDPPDAGEQPDPPVIGNDPEAGQTGDDPNAPVTT